MRGVKIEESFTLTCADKLEKINDIKKMNKCIFFMLIFFDDISGTIHIFGFFINNKVF